MTGRARVRAIIAGEPADRCAFWVGHPFQETWPILHRIFGTTTEQEFRRRIGDDFVLVPLQWCPDFYEGGVFQIAKARDCEPGPLAACASVADVDRLYDWPEASKCNFDSGLALLRQAGDVYRASGVWAPIYHNFLDLFGLEEGMVMMHTAPDIVEAAAERVFAFYYEANERFLELAGDEVDACFFGNDLGTQRGLMCSPEMLDRFFFPYLKRLVAQAKRHGKQAILHSCGAVHEIIPRLIDIGVDCLHPLQALAKGMDAQALARDFKGRIAFMGGVDTQELLIHGTPDDVRREVRRLKETFGPRYIVSPSHEALLPDVPPENVRAMAEEAVGGH